MLLIKVLEFKFLFPNTHFTKLLNTIIDSLFGSNIV